MLHYFCTDWDGPCDHSIDVPWHDIFKLSASAAASEFCEWVQVGINVYIDLITFVYTNRINLLNLTFRWVSNRCKRVLEAAKLAYAAETNESIISQKLDSQDFWGIANSVLNKNKFTILLLFNGPEVLSSASDKVKPFAKIFSKNFNLDDLGISLPVFPSRTNLKLYSISVTPKMV